MSSSGAPSTLQSYDLHTPPTLIDHHQNVIYKPHKMPPIAPTNINVQIHVGD